MTNQEKEKISHGLKLLVSRLDENWSLAEKKEKALGKNEPNDPFIGYGGIVFGARSMGAEVECDEYGHHTVRFLGITAKSELKGG